MNCPHCNNKTKISSYYPDMWFCSNCTNGDYLNKVSSSKQKSHFANTIIEVGALPGFGQNSMAAHIFQELVRGGIPSELVQELNHPWVKNPPQISPAYPDSLLTFSNKDVKVYANSILFHELYMNGTATLLDLSHFEKRQKENIKTIFFWIPSSFMQNTHLYQHPLMKQKQFIEKELIRRMNLPRMRSLGIEFYEINSSKEAERILFPF